AFETRSPPRSLASALAVLPSMSRVRALHSSIENSLAPQLTRRFPSRLYLLSRRSLSSIPGFLISLGFYLAQNVIEFTGGHVAFPEGPDCHLLGHTDAHQ